MYITRCILTETATNNSFFPNKITIQSVINHHLSKRNGSSGDEEEILNQVHQ